MQQLTTQHEPKKKLEVVHLYEQLRNSLAARLARGEWKLGFPLPNETDLAREYGISSGTMRKALDLLEGEGLITRIQGRGTFVADKKADDDKRMLDCLMAADDIVRQSIEEAGTSIHTRAQASLRVYISEALFKAGYVVEPDDE